MAYERLTVDVDVTRPSYNECTITARVSALYVYMYHGYLTFVALQYNSCTND